MNSIGIFLARILPATSSCAGWCKRSPGFALRAGALCGLAALLACAFTSVAAQSLPGNEAWNFSFLFENDLFAESDQNYTNGIQIGFISPDLSHYREADKLPRWLLPIVERLPFINEPGLQRNVGFSLGQKMFTPEAVERSDLILTDRPYAGWLYAGVAFHNKNLRRLDTMELQIGLMGPASLANRRKISSMTYVDCKKPRAGIINSKPSRASC